MSERLKASRGFIASDARKARSRALQLPASVENIRIFGNIDAEIAKRLRALRVQSGMSQTALGQYAGVSYQQMQKYEHGKDRIAASTIQRFASALNVPVEWFFEQAETPSVSDRILVEDIEVAKRIRNLKDSRVRRSFIFLLDALSKENISDSQLVRKRLVHLSDCIAEIEISGDEGDS